MTAGPIAEVQTPRKSDLGGISERVATVLTALAAASAVIFGLKEFDETTQIRRTEATLGYYTEFLEHFGNASTLLRNNAVDENRVRTAVLQARCQVYARLDNPPAGLPDCRNLGPNDLIRLEPFKGLHDDPDVNAQVNASMVAVTLNAPIDEEELSRFLGFYNALLVCVAGNTCDNDTAHGLFAREVTGFLRWTCHVPPDRFPLYLRQALFEGLTSGAPVANFGGYCADI